MPVTRTSLPGGAVVAVANRCRASRFAGAAPSWAARSTPGRHEAVSAVGRAKTASSASAGWIEIKQRHRHAQPEDPPARREHRHEDVIEDEYLVAQHRQPVQVIGALVVFDGGHRRLEPGNVRFERDGQSVAEIALDATADHPQEPRRGRREAQPHRRGEDESAVVRQHAVGEPLQP